MNELEKEAERIYKKLLDPETSRIFGDPTSFLGYSLRAVHDAAIEKAAKNLDFSSIRDLDELAKRIRALKLSGGGE